MIKSLTVTNDKSEKLTLELYNPEKSGVAVRSISGLGPVKIAVKQQELHGLDGARITNFKTGIRNIVMSLAYLEFPDVESSRHLTYRMFPEKKKIKLEIQTDHRFVGIEGYVEHNDSDIFSKQSGAQISILCEKPYFYETGYYGERIFTVNTQRPLFEFPFLNNNITDKLIIFGDVGKEDSASLMYNGDVSTGVIAEFSFAEDVDSVLLSNTTNSTIIAARGPFKAGERVVVSTIAGEKYIKKYDLNNNVYNIIKSLNLWNTLLILERGDNVLALNVYPSTKKSSVKTFISYRNYYEGV